VGVSASAETRPVRSAVLDLGSNSFHVLVADVHNGTVTPVRREREMLHLGRTLAVHGHIPAEEHARAVETVEWLGGVARRSGAEQVHAVATAALREDAASDLLADLSRALGGRPRHRIEVLDPADEGRLALIGARAAGGTGPGSTLVIDLGGGSMQLTVGTDAGIVMTVSVPLGVSRLSAEFTENPPEDAEVRRLTKHVDAVLEDAVRQVRAHRPQRVVVLGGTVRALAVRLAARADEWLPSSVNLAPLRLDELVEVRDELLALPASERAKLPGVKSRRADHLHVAAVVLTRTLELLDAREAVVSDWGLREGILLDRHGDGHVERSAMRAAEIDRLRRSLSGEDPHPLHVAHLAGSLFSATRRLHGLEASDGELLVYAAQLHSIGSALALRRHQVHAAYLLEHAELRGFTPDESAMMVTLVRFHPSRGISSNFPAFARLDEDAQHRTTWLLMLLQLADALDAARDQRVRLEKVRLLRRGMEMVISGRGVDLDLVRRAVDGSRLTRSLLGPSPTVVMA
jgi:exopolyphosphatase / guanosine-5'-triphosphate,3'-diphosphate pyrophosphatase